MADSSDPAQSSSLWPPTKLPLASITPDVVAAGAALLEGAITLLWPFSPSSSTLSVLVCEDDVRLRLSKGQLRVAFRGASARDVNSHGIQIGDRIQLSLEGAELESLKDVTPRDVPWSLVYSTRLVMKIRDGASWRNVEVDAPAEDPEDATAELDVDDYDNERGLVTTTPPRQPINFSQSSENLWSTPGLFKRKGDLLANSPLYLQRLFGDEDDDLDVEEERPRKKPRFSNSYRLVDRSPSPDAEREGSSANEDGVSHTGPKAVNTAATISAIPNSGPLVIYRDSPSPIKGPLEAFPDGQPTQAEMRPPSAPVGIVQQDNAKQAMEESEIPGSPLLKPVPSPQLPLVSPFPHRGLPSDNYLSVDKEGSDIPQVDLPDDRSAVEEVQVAVPSTEPPQESSTVDRREEGSPVGMISVTPERSRPASDGESEKDSLFDDMSDVDEVRSPLPGSSQLRKALAMEPFQTPRLRPSKLNLTSPGSPLRGPLKTPQLYLPTPSPKVTSSNPLDFPLAAAPRSDPDARIPLKSLETAPDTPRGQRRKLLRQSLDAAPTDLSTYFGTPKASIVAPSRDFEDPADDRSEAEAPITPEDEEDERVAQFKSGTTTSLSDFPPLTFLSWGTTIDVIGVVCQYSSVARTESGAKDYYMAMRIVDSSKTVGIVMRVFRPFKIALPEVEVGDVVLLRSFKIISHKHKFMGVSTENSAWAVFRDAGKQCPGICAGPPVEYGAEEERYAADIGAWYRSLGAQTRQDIEGKHRDELVAGIR